ncbi:MAG: ABC transporter permease [Chloroflexi bacterium]|jgi:ABC-2 type transport system permease protein|nr:ABC transporter permease [Chloroflexota bacterium]MBT3668764.1 ABC transporter permease [Chloroflexota bacterium]MBT4003227.1 ABC transporter permease [Chloroflexota bacterium]MBT4305465.1 ABC transporter permease [Chloroflexota bacterium]MBT4533076.1 ABC transporter permease [Chloroflexota bacterium]
MRLFIEIAMRAFRLQMSYRAAAIAGLLTNFFFGILRAVVLIALYDGREEMLGLSLQAAITYTAITQAVIGYLSAFSWYDVANTVYSGEIGSDLLKPINFYSYWMARDFGRAMAALLTRGLPIMVAYEIFIDISFPNFLLNWGLLILTVLLSWVVSFSWRFIVNLPSFWIPNAFGIGRFFFMAALFFSGFLMPLRFFPDWVVKLAYLTPFPHTVNTVVEIYLGVLSPVEIWLAFAWQVGWIVALILVGQWILKLGLRRLVILGG